MSRRSSRLMEVLERLAEELAAWSDADAVSATSEALDRLIESLDGLRATVHKESIPAPVNAIEEVVQFLRQAKSDPRLTPVLISFFERPPRKPAKKPLAPVRIEPNLTNEQIRALLESDLARSELVAIANQRAIRTAKRSKADLRQAIRDFIDRQEGYSHLRT